MLKDYMNPIFDSNETFNAIMNAQQPEFDLQLLRLREAFDNNFVSTATIIGIQRFEKMLGIIPDPSVETLEFRRARLLTELAAISPYTRRFFERMLENIFGRGNWSLDVDYNNFIVFVDVRSEIPLLFEQTMAKIKQLMPANLVVKTTSSAPFTHRYLNENYTHAQMAAYTHAHFGQYQ